MKNLNPIDTRDQCRRVEERRNHSRRLIKYPFGSAKWVEAVQSTYIMWPREDRRDQDRRIVSRRRNERRNVLHAYRRRSRHQRMMDRTIRSQALTIEERNMLNDLNRRF
jgi:hypothetical protein